MLKLYKHIIIAPELLGLTSTTTVTSSAITEGERVEKYECMELMHRKE
jgi:hypothetical protein